MFITDDRMRWTIVILSKVGFFFIYYYCYYCCESHLLPFAACVVLRVSFCLSRFLPALARIIFYFLISFFLRLSFRPAVRVVVRRSAVLVPKTTRGMRSEWIKVFFFMSGDIHTHFTTWRTHRFVCILWLFCFIDRRKTSINRYHSV